MKREVKDKKKSNGNERGGRREENKGDDGVETDRWRNRLHFIYARGLGAAMQDAGLPIGRNLGFSVWLNM